jgi:hypothetical protein
VKKKHDVGETRKRVSHKYHQSLRATRTFDARFFTGASKRDTREDWPKPKLVKRNFKRREVLEPECKASDRQDLKETTSSEEAQESASGKDEYERDLERAK